MVVQFTKKNPTLPDILHPSFSHIHKLEWPIIIEIGEIILGEIQTVFQNILKNQSG